MFLVITCRQIVSAHILIESVLLPPRLLVQTGGKSCYKEHTGACRPCHGDTSAGQGWPAGIGNLQDAVLIPGSPVSSASSGQIYPQNKTWMRISIRFIAVPPCNAGIILQRMRKTETRATGTHCPPTACRSYISQSVGRWKDPVRFPAQNHSAFQSVQKSSAAFPVECHPVSVTEKSAVPHQPSSVPL